jgi:2'-5' RNA ligase
MSEVTRYALWLLPDAAAGDAFGDAIVRLSGRYQGPRFTPHVTLLGWVTGAEQQLAQTTAQLAQQLRVLHLRGSGFDGEQYYFRCFYLKLEASQELMQAHERASAAFNAGHSSDYMPHLSLVYGQGTVTDKAALTRELATSLPSEFSVDRLQLVHITVSVADWRVVTTCALGSASQLPAPLT